MANSSAFAMQNYDAVSLRDYEGDDPNGIRTRVTAVKGRCPGPLDDRVAKTGNIGIEPLSRKANYFHNLF